MPDGLVSCFGVASIVLVTPHLHFISILPSFKIPLPIILLHELQRKMLFSSGIYRVKVVLSLIFLKLNSTTFAIMVNWNEILIVDYMHVKRKQKNIKKSLERND